MFGALLISGRQWLFPAAVLLLLALLVLLWGYSKTPARPGLRTLCFGLKLLGLLALLACLLEPLWSGQRARPGANFFALVADNSQGMQIKDRNASRSRGDFLRDTLNADKRSWQGKLDEHFQVRRYLFDSRLQSVGDFSELTFAGRSTSMAAALRSVAERYKGQPLAGVLLFTDGNATDIGNETISGSGLPPIYPVVLGTDDPIKDIGLNNVTVSQTSFEDAPVTIQAEAVSVGYAGEKIVAQLIEVASRRSSATNAARSTTPVPAARKDASAARKGAPVAGKVAEKVVAELTQKAPKDGEPVSVRFQVRPDKTGLLYYRLRVAAADEVQHFSEPARSTEATLANNQRLVVVDRGRGPYRVLYVGGRPNWEYKFLNRAVAEDDEVQLVGLIRVARREPKFEFRGRAGESSNPLFRGFDRKTEETERYDQPVLVRLNTRDEIELRGGFPKTPEDLYPYHAIILDDLDAEFFTPDQMLLLQKFVSERGGGFLMLGGQESFGQGKFHRTPIGDMLPVYLDQVSDSAPPPAELRLTLTREGWLQPWARLRSNEEEEKARIDSMVPFQVLNRVRGIKPGASVIATVAGSQAAQYPAVVVQRFGNGRTAALTLGDLWRWGLHEEQASKDLAKAWRQLVRWLVADVPNRVEIQTEYTRGDPNQPVVLQVRARDGKFQPLDNASIKVVVHPVAKTEANAGPPAPAVELDAEPVLTEPGLYQASYVPRENGGYHAEAVVTNSVGAEAGRAALGWTTDLAAEEFRSLKPNRALLESIAKKTGGEVIESSKLEEFANRLPHRKVPITENWSFPLWHTPAVFLFALACFVAEWGIRRWKGLA